MFLDFNHVRISDNALIAVSLRTEEIILEISSMVVVDAPTAASPLRTTSASSMGTGIPAKEFLTIEMAMERSSGVENKYS
jgi:hypothetical protein